MPFFGEAVENTAGAEGVGVDGGDGGGDDHDIENVCGGGNAECGEDLNEGTCFAGDLIPRGEGHDDRECGDVEEEDPKRHRVDGAGNGQMWIGGLSGGNADCFDAATGRRGGR